MQKNQKRTRALEQLIDRECALYQEYLSVLDAEKKAMTSFRADDIFANAAKRETLVESMQQLQADRLALVADLPDGEKRKLSEVIREHMHPEDGRILMPLVERLKKLVGQVRRAEMEFKQVLQFSMNLVCSTTSLITSGTQNMNRGYTRRGAMRESFVPPVFTAPTLKQA